MEKAFGICEAAHTNNPANPAFGAKDFHGSIIALANALTDPQRPSLRTIWDRAERVSEGAFVRSLGGRMHYSDPAVDAEVTTALYRTGREMGANERQDFLRFLQEFRAKYRKLSWVKEP